MTCTTMVQILLFGNEKIKLAQPREFQIVRSGLPHENFGFRGQKRNNLKNEMFLKQVECNKKQKINVNTVHTIMVFSSHRLSEFFTGVHNALVRVI